MAEEHGHELGPTGESLGPDLGAVQLDQGGELGAGEVMQQLTEQAGYSFHGLALSWSRYCLLFAEPHYHAEMMVSRFDHLASL
ncbi:MAG: hypothetical protein V1797_18530 [Pseudomonadota bacterium]